MKQEVVATGKTVEAAVASGAALLGVSVSYVTYEVLEQPKKGFLGFGEAPAKVKVVYLVTPEMIALQFVRNILADMNITATAEITRDAKAKRDRIISITGEDAAVLIGHHGETLESLQYLVNLAANRREEETAESGAYSRIFLDIENYRAKREETLKRLARRMAEKVIKYRKPITLEPMNPYERRIIHSEVQSMKGVSSSSIGTDNTRRVVISLSEENEGTRFFREKSFSSQSGQSKKDFTEES